MFSTDAFLFLNIFNFELIDCVLLGPDEAGLFSLSSLCHVVGESTGVYHSTQPQHNRLNSKISSKYGKSPEEGEDLC